MSEEAQCRIDEKGPFPVHRPSAVGEIGEWVKQASANDQAVFPLGGQTMLGLGLPPQRNGIAIDLRSLAQIIDFPARDMTVTVQSGITIARLQEILKPENLQLPVDVPKPAQATLGGAIAANVSGPRRYGFGTLRDYVIGISTVNDQGQEVKAGGRVVKNVAGYDLCKLHTGALGTLGIIAQITLKLKPLPEEKALIVIPCAASSIEPLLQGVQKSRARPVVVDLLNAEAVKALPFSSTTPLPQEEFLLILGLEESQEAVSWQIEEILREMSGLGSGGLDARVSRASEPLWEALTEFRLLPCSLMLKANLLPHAVPSFCQWLQSAAPEGRIYAHAGNGIVYGSIPNELPLEQAQSLVSSALEQAKKAAGNVILIECPVAWKASLPVWGSPRQDAILMKAVKEKLDPKRLFNPGRFLEGI